MSIQGTVRAWVEVDLDAVRENYLKVRDAIPSGTGIIPMVKADAYGLGAERIVRVLEPLRPLAYGVATAAEGAALRGSGVQRPILVFSSLQPDAMAAAADARLTACVSDMNGLDAWARATGPVEPLDFHVEIDTGMGRAGFDWRQAARWDTAIRARTGDHLRWAGVFTHFHSAGLSASDATRLQWSRFREALDVLEEPSSERIVHAANSAAAMRWPDYGLDAVRPGIVLYGGRALADPAAAGVTPPRPAVAVRARLALVKEVPAGSTVGYGATHVAREPARWGTVSLGYGDGLPVAMSNEGEALVRGRRVPIIGRVSMDMTTIDLTEVSDARPGDVVTLIGTDEGQEISLEQVAARAHTINYEILTRLGPRLPRVEYSV